MTDKQKKLLAKYSRIGEDRSQLQQFTKDVITGEIGGGGSGGEEKPLKTISFEMGYSDFTPVTLKVFNITNQSLIPLIDELFNTKATLSYKISGENGNSMYATQECVCLYVEDIDGEHFCIYDRDDQTKTLKRCFGVSRTADVYLLSLEDLSNCPVGEIVNYCMNNNLKMKFEFTLPISSGSGGSVEAEPIVSIKMTNMDLRPADDSSSTELDNVQLYCTKETWNNMVAYAKQLSSSLDITYDNFGTIYATLPTRTQGALVGFLMMDYLNGKVLPNSYTEVPLSVTGSDANIQRFLNLTNTFQDENTSNVKVILGAVFGGSGSGSYFPSLDRITVPYTTQNTIITVEEIAGPAIGSGSGGSGTSDVLYKHSIVVYLQGDTPEEEPSPVQFNFLSKYAEPFVTDGSLADFITAFTAKNDFQAAIQASLNEINGPSGFYVSNIVIDDTKITLLSAVSNNINYTFGFKFEDNVSGITDTVTPYIQVSGGSGSSTTTSQYDYIQMCFNSSNNSHIILMFDKQYSRADDIAPQVNQLITTLNQMGSLSIPAYTDLESLEDIADYLNLLDTQTYAQIKVIFWASVFSLYPYLCLSVKGYNNGMLVPVIVEGIADMGNQNFAYTIKMMDNTGAMVPEASEQTVFDFDIFVNKLD